MSSRSEALADETRWDEWAQRLDFRSLPGYQDEPIPGPTDDVVAALPEAYLDWPTETRARFVERLGQQHTATLTTFADHAASLSLRRRDVRPLSQALVALGIALTLDDCREVLPAIAVCRDAAERLGTTLKELIAVVAPALGQAAIDVFVEFATRAPSEGTLRDMGYEMTLPEEGFRYRLMSVDETLSQMPRPQPEH
jgi:hypothetical protein